MSTAAIQRALPAAPVTAAVATAQIFAALNSNPAIPCILNCPGSNRLEQKRFTVRASGDVTTVGAYTVAATLYAALVTPANPFTPASWSALGTATPIAVGTTSCGWMLEADVLFDTLSGKMQGEFLTNINNTFAAKAAIANPLTAIVGSTEPVMVFAVGLTFSAGAAGNIGRMADFSLIDA